MKNINFLKKIKIVPVVKMTFHITNFLLIILYLYPGSILGCFFYQNCAIQPQLTSDFAIYTLPFSSNHVYVFSLVSVLGFFSYSKKKHFIKVFIYLIFLSIILELMHLIIPERGFEIADLLGNIIGVIVALVIVLTIKIWRKK